MTKKIDPGEIKWFGPLWRRIVLALIMAGWCVAEWFGGDQFWFLMTLAVLAYLIWRLFIAFPNAAEIAAYEAEQKQAAADLIARQKADYEAAERDEAEAAKERPNEGS